MAVADYYDEEFGDIDYEAFLDDVEDAGKISGDSGSGRSDEYLGYGEDIDTSYGYVEWYLYLSDDDFEYMQGTDYQPNMEVSIGVNLSPSASDDTISEAERIADSGPLGYVYTDGADGDVVHFEFNGPVDSAISFSSKDELLDPEIFSKKVGDVVNRISKLAKDYGKQLDQIVNPQ